MRAEDESHRLVRHKRKSRFRLVTWNEFCFGFALLAIITLLFLILARN